MVSTLGVVHSLHSVNPTVLPNFCPLFGVQFQRRIKRKSASSATSYILEVQFVGSRLLQAIYLSDNTFSRFPTAVVSEILSSTELRFFFLMQHVD